MRDHRTRKIFRISTYMSVIIALLFSALITLPSSAASENQSENRPLVYVVPVVKEVEKGLHAFMTRAFNEAESAGADHIILDMDTPGGAVIAADDIGKLMQNTTTPITVYVNPNAISAGAFIALNADHIVMSPTGTMGAATVIDMEGNAADAKSMSFWISKMRNAAGTNDRDPLYAEAMVDPDIEIEGLTSKETPLTFAASEAVEYGYAEAIVQNMNDILTYLDLQGAIIEEVEITFAEQLARFITNPIVVSILLSLASLGLILELYSPGFGVPGAIGLSSLLLFFFGHMVAGFAGWESLIMFLLGAVFIVLEIFTAGFGLFGLLGIASVVASLVLASVDIITGLKSIGIAFIVAMITIIILGAFFDRKGLWSKLVLKEELSTEEGKVYHQKRSELLGKKGVALNMLRPAGIARIDGKEYDVVSSGRTIPLGATVHVVIVEGTRIVVTQIEDDQ